jgi:hypothetical protein
MRLPAHQDRFAERECLEAPQVVGQMPGQTVVATDHAVLRTGDDQDDFRRSTGGDPGSIPGHRFRRGLRRAAAVGTGLGVARHIDAGRGRFRHGAATP